MGKLTEENRFKKMEQKIKKLNNWKYHSPFLKKEFIFGSYPEAVLFTNILAFLAQKLDHHPDILLKYNFVSLSLSTHDIGDISDKDIQFAKKVDNIMKELETNQF